MVYFALLLLVHIQSRMTVRSIYTFHRPSHICWRAAFGFILVLLCVCHHVSPITCVSPRRWFHISVNRIFALFRGFRVVLPAWLYPQGGRGRWVGVSSPCLCFEVKVSIHTWMEQHVHLEHNAVAFAFRSTLYNKP